MKFIPLDRRFLISWHLHYRELTTYNKTLTFRYDVNDYDMISILPSSHSHRVKEAKFAPMFACISGSCDIIITSTFFSLGRMFAISYNFLDFLSESESSLCRGTQIYITAATFSHWNVRTRDVYLIPYYSEGNRCIFVRKLKSKAENSLQTRDLSHMKGSHSNYSLQGGRKLYIKLNLKATGTRCQPQYQNY